MSSKSMLPSKCCFCMDLDKGVKAYQVILNFEVFYCLMWLHWTIMWCLWKPPTYEDYDWTTDPFAADKYDTKLNSQYSCVHPFIPYEWQDATTYYIESRQTLKWRNCDWDDIDSDCNADPEKAWELDQAARVYLDDGEYFYRVPSGACWGFVLVLILFIVALILRSVALGQAHKEISQIGKAKAGSTFLMTYFIIVLGEVLNWVLLWLTVGKYGPG